MLMNKIVFLNDKYSYNILYRRELASLFESKGFNVLSLGLFDGITSFLRIVMNILLSVPILSSNLKSNLFFLLFWFRPGLVIINGFGRFRQKKWFRALMLLLIHINNRSKYIAVQNYADWRYLKKYVYVSDQIVWCPGSGGIRRNVNLNDVFFVVQRLSKIECVKKSILDFIENSKVSSLTVVGCEHKDIVALMSMDDCDVYGVGYQNQSDIFAFGNNFVQPIGYGEGFPHTMADAIVSGLNVYMPKKLYVQLGLYVLNIKCSSVFSGWVNIRYDHKSVDYIKSDFVNNLYYDLMSNVIARSYCC